MTNSDFLASLQRITKLVELINGQNYGSIYSDEIIIRYSMKHKTFNSSLAKVSPGRDGGVNELAVSISHMASGDELITVLGNIEQQISSALQSRFASNELAVKAKLNNFFEILALLRNQVPSEASAALERITTDFSKHVEQLAATIRNKAAEEEDVKSEKPRRKRQAGIAR